MTGAELEWRNVVLASDSSSWAVLVTGLASGGFILMGFLAAALVAKDPCYAVAEVAVDILKSVFHAKSENIPLHRRLLNQQVPSSRGKLYLPVKVHEIESASMDGYGDMEYLYDERCAKPGPRAITKVAYAIVSISLVAQALGTVLRPSNNTLLYMSWTLALLPLTDLMHSNSGFSGRLVSAHSTNMTLFNTTALRSPIELPWLPKKELAGFKDWYGEDKQHYFAGADPLKISNLDDRLLPELRDIDLADVPIRHIMLIKLESTRKDVFPMRKAGMAYERLANLTESRTLTPSAEAFLANLTPIANFITGDYNTGFATNLSEKDHIARGGINANNAYTTSTYTFKSLTGTHCGVSPLAADFNQEYHYPIYQPCLPHIFEALNSINSSESSKGRGFNRDDWKSLFMMSVTNSYDKQDKLMPALGFTENNTITWQHLSSKDAKFGPTTAPDINYFGPEERILEEYIRDAFAMAKTNNERLFLSHLTSTTHHSFHLPEGEPVVTLTDDEDWIALSDYLNAVGYVDKWLGTILGILDEQGVTNETLVVFVGDHGLSIAETCAYTPYGNPNVGNYHVPLVISHPKLPSISIDDAVQSSMILPTILDLLIETKSLSDTEERAVRDLLQNYEGQSLLRPLQKTANGNMGGWQFTVMNPGGSTVAVRDARQPQWRLIVPFSGHYEWKFTDLSLDVHELSQPTVSFELSSLMDALGAKNGSDKAIWVEEAAVVADWWVKENHRRWQYE